MGWPGWTGLGERRWKTAPNEQVQPPKTLWDLLQLLIVPVILVGISLWWSASQTARDNSRQDRSNRDATLNTYIEQMSELMLKNGLSSSKPGDPVRSVARTLTLTALRRLDGERKGEVVRFLQDARLTRLEGGPTVSLAGADLTGADLGGALLVGADLSFAYLGSADLSGANLDDADLGQADLRGARLEYTLLLDALLGSANLTGAHLKGAHLSHADLGSAGLTGADLRDADLTGADLTAADLTGTDLKGANLTGVHSEGEDP